LRSRTRSQNIIGDIVAQNAGSWQWNFKNFLKNRLKLAKSQEFDD
jgi:hypothetical protein